MHILAAHAVHTASNGHLSPLGTAISVGIVATVVIALAMLAGRLLGSGKPKGRPSSPYGRR